MPPGPDFYPSMTALYHDPHNLEGTTYGKRWLRHQWQQIIEEQATDNAETQKIVDKYTNSTCVQIAEMKSEKPQGEEAQMKERVIAMLSFFFVANYALSYWSLFLGGVPKPDSENMCHSVSGGSDNAIFAAPTLDDFWITCSTVNAPLGCAS